MDDQSILISAHAKLPSGIAAAEMYGVMALVLVVDVAEGTIVDVECTLSTKMAERFVAKLLTGKSLKHGPKELIELIEAVYQGSAQKAIITALRDISNKYGRIRSQRGLLP